MAQNQKNNEICCPEFNPIPWNEKILEWNNKKFIKDSVRTFFYMPLNFGPVMRRLSRKIERHHVAVPDNLGISDHTSRWNMDIYLAVDKELPDAENITLSGRFASKVYEGPYRDTTKWGKDFNAWCSQCNVHPARYFMWYTTCRKCAKKYGKNYVVMMAMLG